MSTKQKVTKQQQTEKDAAESRRFLIILGVATVVVMLIMYLIFVR